MPRFRKTTRLLSNNKTGKMLFGSDSLAQIFLEKWKRALAGQLCRGRIIRFPHVAIKTVSSVIEKNWNIGMGLADLLNRFRWYVRIFFPEMQHHRAFRLFRGMLGNISAIVANGCIN